MRLTWNTPASLASRTSAAVKRSPMQPTPSPGTAPPEAQGCSSRPALAAAQSSGFKSAVYQLDPGSISSTSDDLTRSSQQWQLTVAERGGSPFEIAFSGRLVVRRAAAKYAVPAAVRSPVSRVAGCRFFWWSKKGIEPSVAWPTRELRCKETYNGPNDANG